MFWLSKLPKLVKEPAPIVFSRLTPLKPTRRMEVGLNRLTRSISQVSNMSRPTRSLKRSLSIVSSYSRSARNSRSRSGSQQRTLQVPYSQNITLPIPERTHRRFHSVFRVTYARNTSSLKEIIKVSLQLFF